MAKVLFHIDMDSFFVSCERALNPRLNNKPIIIANNYKRAIISAMSYEIKNLGFRVGDPFYKVKNKLPDTIVISPHYELYSLTSKKIFEFINKNYGPHIEIYSIDECYLDVTMAVKKYDSPITYAKKIQDDILKYFKIPCSIGISYTKFLAKMSTNKIKPFGILETKKGDIINNFYSLPVKKIFGVGKKISLSLEKANLKTYEDIINCKNILLLNKIFGKNYFIFIKTLKGENETFEHELVENTKGISNSITFTINDSNDPDFLHSEIFKLAENVFRRAKDQCVTGSLVSISIRNVDKIWKTKQKKLSYYVANIHDLYEVAYSLFDEFWNGEMIRGLGIHLSNLRSLFEVEQYDLFTEYNNESKINKIINSINFQYDIPQLKTVKQLLVENGKDINNIKFLRKNITKTKNEIELEEKWK